MIRPIVTVAALLTLAGCNDRARSSDPLFDQQVGAGIVSLAAEAPDGTKLWGVRPPGTSRIVYFASSGTQTTHTEHCGKNCTRTIDDIVPSVPSVPLAGEGPDGR